MNRIINVNIGGIIFQIDELAFQKLDNYLSALKLQFRGQEGSDEIIADIEARIAELFTEKLKSDKDAILERDVEDVIMTMGMPEDYEVSEEEDESKKGYEGYQYTNTPRRFFRNPDDKILGGICGGMASYFNIDPLILRLLFVVFFFAWGTGVLIYILLWILIPEATTTADKLQMRGQPVNINSIQQSIREETDRIKKKLEDIGNDPGLNNKVKQGGDNFRRIVGSFFSLITILFKVLFKVVIIAILVALAISFIALIFGLGGAFNAVTFYRPDLSTYLFEDGGQRFFTAFSLALLVAIPLLVLLYKALRYLLKVGTSTKPLDYTMLALWIVALVVLGFSSTRISLDFQSIGKVKEQQNLYFPANKTLLLELDKSQERQLSEDFDYLYDINQCRIYDDTIVFRDIELDIQVAPDTLISLLMTKSARGNTREKGKELASQIVYEITRNDSILSFPSNFHIGENKLWRNQQIDLILRVPEGQCLELHPSITRILDNAETANFIPDNDLYGSPLKMTSRGLVHDTVLVSQLPQN